MLLEINDGVDDEWAQVITEDQAEGVVRRRVRIEEGRIFGIAGRSTRMGRTSWMSSGKWRRGTQRFLSIDLLQLMTLSMYLITKPR